MSALELVVDRSATSLGSTVPRGAAAAFVQGLHIGRICTPIISQRRAMAISDAVRAVLNEVAMKKTLVIALMAGCGCGEVNEAPVDAPVDTPVDMAEPPPPPRCSPTAPFGAPQLVPGLASSQGNQFNIALTPDELTIFFARQPGPVGGVDVMVATRADRAGTFGTPTPVAGVNSAQNEFHPSLTPDGLTLYLGSDRNGNADVFKATRASRSEDFGAPQPVAEVNTASGERAASVIGNVGAMYLSRMVGTTENVLRAAATATGFAAPERVAGLPPDAAGLPVVTEDELDIFFASGDMTTQADVFHATRSSASQPFSGATRVTELNTLASDEPSWLSPDGCVLYLSSNRSGRSELYVATRGP